MVDFYLSGMRLVKGLCVTSDEGKNYYEIGEFMRKKPSLKVAEHSFQVCMPNVEIFFDYLCLGARFLQESRSTTERFILAFWIKCVSLLWKRGWLKRSLKRWFFFVYTEFSR